MFLCVSSIVTCKHIVSSYRVLSLGVCLTVFVFFVLTSGGSPQR